MWRFFGERVVARRGLSIGNMTACAVKRVAKGHRSAELARKLEQLEERIEAHDQEITAIFDAIREMMAPPEKRRKRIGFDG